MQWPFASSRFRRPTTRAFVSLLPLVCGFVVSATFVGSLVHAAGNLVLPKGVTAARLGMIVSIVGLVFLGISASLSGATMPFFGRQTPQRFERTCAGTLVWGLDAGLIVTTVRMTTLSPLALVLILLHIAPWWAGFIYGLGFSLALTVSIFVCRGMPNGDTAVSDAIDRAKPLVRWGGMVVVAATVLVFAGDRPNPGLIPNLARAILISVFLVSGLSKMVTPNSIRATILGLGGGSATARVLGSSVTVVELSVAGLLSITSTAPFGLAIATVAFLTFAVTGLVALRRPQKIRCACFGSSSTYLGWRQVISLPVWLTMVAAAGSAGFRGSVSGQVPLLAVGLAACWALAGTAQDWDKLRFKRLQHDTDRDALVRFNENGGVWQY